MFFDFEKPKVIAFDFDGTIVDTMQGYADVAAKTMSEHYDISFEKARELYLQTSGIPFCFQLEEILGECEENKITAEIFEREKLNVMWRAEPDCDCKEVFDELILNGIYVVISSNNMEQNVFDYVKKYDLPVSLTLGYREGFGKGREHFDAICKTYNCSYDDVVFVGDSLSDAKKANNCGIRFIAKQGTFTRSELCDKLLSCPVISNLKEIIALIGLKHST